MKKITLMLLIIGVWSLESNAQCTTGDAYQGSALVNSGEPETQSTCNYFGEYNNTTNVIDGNDYVFATDSGYVTVTTSDGLTVLGHGPSPLTITGLTTSGDGAIRVYWHLDNLCGTDASCHETTVQCISPSCSPPPPQTNDLCVDAIPVMDGMDYQGDTSATEVSNDLQGDCGSVDNDSNNLWYSYTGSGSPEVVTLSTCNQASFDTSIAVFTGECGALVCYANNDDGPGCTGFSSLAEFVSDGSDTYYIMVEGYSATSTGTFTLSVSAVPAASPPANDDCVAAEALVLGTPLAGDNTNATNATSNPSCDLFGTISDVWYSFEAPATGAVDINAAVGTADVAEMAVYDGCGGTELGCSASGDLFVKDLTVGATYYLQVWNDGAAGARTEGTFTITASESTLSLEDQAFAGFKYFPNPTTGNLSLRAQDNIQAVSVYNMIGQEVLRATPNTLTDELDMSGLNTGAYFLKVRINDAEQNFRIIKE